jgi:Holliday junction resolvasome RuvABC endonuclease subunit
MVLKSEFCQGSQALHHSDSGCKVVAMRVETYSMNHTVYQKVEIILHLFSRDPTAIEKLFIRFTFALLFWGQSLGLLFCHP